MENVVIIRAFGGEPLRRVVIDATPTKVFVANPDYIDRIRSGDSDPVGIPRFDVFEYDEASYQRLLNEWVNQGVTANHSWRQLSPWSGRIYA